MNDPIFAMFWMSVGALWVWGVNRCMNWLTRPPKELPNAALCKWRVDGKVNDVATLVCSAMTDTCHDRFDTPRCRRLYERRP